MPALDVSMPDAPVAAAVLLHPHPDMGGDRHNNVVSALHSALPAAGVAASRFDFTSADVDACTAQVIEAVDALAPHAVPVYLVGYSFGGGVAAAITDDRIAGWYLVAPALSLVTPAIGGDPRPKGIVVAAHDEWFGPDAVATATDGWVATTIDVVAGTDHFFGGHTAEVADLAASWFRRGGR